MIAEVSSLAIYISSKKTCGQETQSSYTCTHSESGATVTLQSNQVIVCKQRTQFHGQWLLAKLWNCGLEFGIAWDSFNKHQVSYSWRVILGSLSALL